MTNEAQSAFWPDSNVSTRRAAECTRAHLHALRQGRLLLAGELQQVVHVPHHPAEEARCNHLETPAFSRGAGSMQKAGGSKGADIGVDGGTAGWSDADHWWEGAAFGAFVRASVLCIRASGEGRQRDGYHERRNVHAIERRVRRNVAEANCRSGAAAAAEGHLPPQHNASIVFRNDATRSSIW